MVVGKEITNEELQNKLKKAVGSLLVGSKVFGLYTGSNIGNRKKEHVVFT